jgi:cobalt-zinc-cadmium efflux system outer membrane protein
MLRSTAFFILISMSAPAAQVRLTFENIETYTVAHNPALAAARLRIDEARGRLRQAGRLRNPEFELEYSQNVRSPENRFAASLTQRFPLTRRLQLEKKLSQAELAVVEAEVRNAERKIVEEARIGLVKLLALRAQRALREKQIGNSRELAEFTRKRMESAEASVIDVTQVELDVAQLNADLFQLKAEGAAILGDLRSVIGASTADSIVIEETLPEIAPPPRPMLNLALRPDFAAATHKTAAARHGEALARAERFEDVGIGFSADRDKAEDMPDGLQRDTMTGIRLSIPLPLWNRNEGRVQEAAAASKRARLEENALAIGIRAEAAAAREQVRMLADLVRSLSGVLLPRAAQIEGQIRTAYSTGQSTLTDVLRARDKRLFLERQRLDALRDYHLARVRHAFVTGQTLQSSTHQE